MLHKLACLGVGHPVSVSVICCWVQVLYSLCQGILQSKPTSLIDDAAALERLQQSESSTERHRLALQFRLAHKGLLQKCMLLHDVGGKLQA